MQMTICEVVRKIYRSASVASSFVKHVVKRAHIKFQPRGSIGA
jgi:hypothetical protein